ncbi:UDP-N-acetylmuramoyl-tripeptide--D-alanyl-D-alanine ligase [Macrococcus hajekii]|uniref:UDP-N-acetylmuramoyl-tripeptide--D-alanyl-D-alanine ligase n=1 Tax=Macrococcus hajekii TaxID=198482 RepID=A0A4R6BHZ7_9STAP|nr:UDP-N-acetylmuramoyl-tripeptide--D-alanyl-D-alanine ligase [Macrococcus hajekii]TDM01079.1 UDP-N-acetylmuramoyl-tripeptide--D-alanyl-D-alanine ligase [Macrococcus hajekii]GGB12568.1 UDP-N-acetylmuramoyl-tripeptide--D-alanyl-D-alanine ligase [Macrococcus hajekii]
MIKRTAKQLAEMSGGTVDERYAEIEVEGVAIDSRHIEGPVLFVPFKGEQTDGHRFVEQALHDGAAISFWQNDVPDAPDVPLIKVDDCLTALQQLSKTYLTQVNPTVIGITGSNGKTTTKDMVASVLSSKFRVKKTIGNYNNEIGLPLTICQLEEVTEVSILEMGMSGFGEIAFLSKLATPDIAVITNIGESHMRDLGSREGIAKAKFEITEGLEGLFIYDGDEDLLKPLAGSYKGEKQSIGFDAGNQQILRDIEQSETAIRFKVGNGETDFKLPMLGLHNVRNAGIAVTIGRYMGLSEAEINQALSHLEMTGMRMEKIQGPNGALLINDAYNASPTSMKAAIDTIDMMAGDCYIVLSDVLELGPDEEMYHRQVGRYFEGKKMTLLATGQAGRFIYEEAAQFIPAHYFATKDEIADYLRPKLSDKTKILFKASRGMKLETIIEALI